MRAVTHPLQFAAAPAQSLAAMLDEARAGLRRVRPEDLEAARVQGALIVDHRDSADQRREGVIPGSVIIRRSVLEWRLAPSSPWREVPVDASSHIICVCNDGESSSLAAASLQRLGLVRATDLIGGYRAWAARADSEPCSPDDVPTCSC